MFTRISIVLIITSVVLAREKNIPVEVSGKQAFVEPDEVLEAALTKVLVPSYNVSEVHVDDERTAGEYEVKIYFIHDVGVDFEAKLEDVLTTRLNFTSALVRPYEKFDTSNRHQVYKTKYTVLLDPQTYRSTLESIAKDVTSSGHVEFRDSEWD